MSKESLFWRCSCLSRRVYERPEEVQDLGSKVSIYPARETPDVAGSRSHREAEMGWRLQLRLTAGHSFTNQEAAESWISQAEVRPMSWKPKV